MIRSSRLVFLALVLLQLADAGRAQGTAPHASTYFGAPGSGMIGRDHAVVVRRGPGNLVTIAGHTTSDGLYLFGAVGSGLATPGAFRTNNAGSVDAFVAQFAGQQLLWCTYLGGSGMELVFDAEVDPVSGITTVVGLTQSTDFPVSPDAHQPTANLGAAGTFTDGFVAQLDPTGAALLYATYFGGSLDDRICDVEVQGGVVTIAGVTESLDLQGTAGTVGPTYHGGLTDAFAAKFVPTNSPPSTQLLWTTYLGGTASEGLDYPSWQGLGAAWEGNLDRMALAVDPGGAVTIATASVSNAATMIRQPCIQSANAGLGDVYLALLDATATALLPGTTFFGGSDAERPEAIAAHPAGGFVIGGYTFSMNMRTTPGCLHNTFQPGPFGVQTEGFVCWIDPASGAQGLRYSTFLSDNGGENAIYALAVETSGLVTVAGWCPPAGNLPVTPRCLQSTNASSNSAGMVARLQFAGQGSQDLLYCSYVGGDHTLLTGLALDEYGDVYLAGFTNSLQYPTTNAFQPTHSGGIGREAVLTHLPLLPGGVGRAELNLATPACGLPLYTGMAGAPVAGMTFGLTATNAPPLSLAVLALGATPPLPPCIPILNACLLIPPPLATIVMPTNAQGFARFPIAIPAPLPSPSIWSLSAQWIILTNAACPGSGPLAASERLDF